MAKGRRFVPNGLSPSIMDVGGQMFLMRLQSGERQANHIT